MNVTSYRPEPVLIHNPFLVTKSVDYSDQEILDTWVAPPTLPLDPTQTMPQFLVGGKGAGRTHLMRYYSAQLQALRHGGDLAKAVEADGYVGLYVHCSGLNHGRFHGKGHSSEFWQGIFDHYFDLWVAEYTLATLEPFIPSDSLSQRDLAQSLARLFLSRGRVGGATNVHGVAKAIGVMRNKLDLLIANAFGTSAAEFVIRSTRGRLIFEIPKLFASRNPALANARFVYLIDEFENLYPAGQEYVNTLVREREDPCAIVVGSRKYGLKTWRTYSGAEENREGAEFSVTTLETVNTVSRRGYEAFCKELVQRRLTQSGIAMLPNLESYFVEYPFDRQRLSETKYALGQTERPHLLKLRQELSQARDHGSARGVTQLEDVEAVLGLVAFPTAPFVEKLNVFLLYQDWASRTKDLVTAASEIGELASQWANGAHTDRYDNAVEKYAADMLAQLLHDYRLAQRYLGLDCFVDMSAGNPRNFLTILKNVSKEIIWTHRAPFDGPGSLSESAQHQGIVDSSHWYYTTNRLAGVAGRDASDAIGRLGEFLKALRFSAKPVESSLCSFQVDLSSLTDRARELIEVAEKSSYLIEVVDGQRDRNSAGIDAKYQLHPMLCPRWDLPIYRRGTTPLTAREANAIFDPTHAMGLRQVIGKRLRSMNPPFLRGRGASADQETLFGD